MFGGTGEYNHFNLLLPGRLRAELPERRQQVLFQGVVQGGQLGGHLLQAGLLQQRSQGRDGGEKGIKEQPKNTEIPILKARIQIASFSMCSDVIST